MSNEQRIVENKRMEISASDNDFSNLKKLEENIESLVVQSGAIENVNDKSLLTIQHSYKFWQFWNFFASNPDPIEKFEQKIFENLTAKFDRYYVNIKNDSLKIWTASVNTESTKTPIVLVHGYCGSIGLWAHNIDKLCETHPLYAFDVLGFGRSSRPTFSTDPIEAENEFVESIEEWRKQVGIGKMILMGHSFGGFLSTAYTLKYPQNIKALVLADPWGFSEPKLQTHELPMMYRVIIRIGEHLSPFSFMRGAGGAVGLRIFKRIRPDFKYKFTSLLGNDSDAIYDYIFHSNRLKPSGEIAFRTVANQLRYAKNPMIKRVGDLDPSIPIWFIYGKDSWIDKTGLSVKEMRDDVSVKIIHDAGHHVYADQPELFNSHVKEILELIDNIHTDSAMSSAN